MFKVITDMRLKPLYDRYLKDFKNGEEQPLSYEEWLTEYFGLE